MWCNFPTCGAEHRARLLETVVAPLLLGRTFEGPAAAFAFLTERCRVLALQAGEPGPLAQVVAGVDVALWDLTARRLDVPLRVALGGAEQAVLPVYASGINPTDPVAAVGRARDEGFRAFKLKIGFDPVLDALSLRAVAADLMTDEQLFADANQAWDLPAARAAIAALGDAPLGFLEEPLRADARAADWAVLAAVSPFPLAAGENLCGETALMTAIKRNALGVVQPDLCKWGGFSGCAPVARAVLAAGKRYFPHYLGGGIGLIASANLLAATAATACWRSTPTRTRRGRRWRGPIRACATARCACLTGPAWASSPTSKRCGHGWWPMPICARPTCPEGRRVLKKRPSP